MKRNLIVLLTILVCGLTACKPGQKKEEDMEKETKLKIGDFFCRKRQTDRRFECG